MDPHRAAVLLRAEVEYLENNYIHLRAAMRANRKRVQEISALLATYTGPPVETLTGGSPPAL